MLKAAAEKEEGGLTVRIEHGDCREVIRSLADGSVDSCVTDPPYALVSIVKRFGGKNAAPVKVSEFFQENGDSKGSSPYLRASAGFMGKQWDTGEVAFDPAFWAEVLRVLKPGGHVLACGGTRSYHRLACAIEDAGFEIRDQIGWLYGSGFPKSHNAGHGWGTALKPAWEPIVLARKPLVGTVAANVLQHGTGAINIDGCRIESGGVDLGRNNSAREDGTSYIVQRKTMRIDNSADKGRWPANVLHDGSDEVVGAFPSVESGRLEPHHDAKPSANLAMSGGNYAGRIKQSFGGDSGSAARFFYSAKADADDRLGSKHPTVKPVDLMRYLCRLITPKGGTVLDPFAGTGTTGVACIAEGFDCILIEREAEYIADIKAKIDWAQGGGPLTESLKRRNIDDATKRGDDAPLFSGAA